ncbi:sigma 54-interacting transcriptional regulator [Clostridiaceae bacterium HSG29]|nr:sigma 54-interacting transcriptional regulator [Clostridiaceae bacterium HSG29]
MNQLFNKKNMKMIFNHIDDGVQIVNTEGELVFCNRKSAIIDDINISDSLGKHITNIYPNLTKKNSTLLKVLEKGVPITDNEQNYLTYKGKKVCTINSTFPIMDNDYLIGAVEISKNITDVKALSNKVVDLQSIVQGKKDAKNEKMKLFDFDDIISNDEEVIRAKDLAKRVANVDINVLVYGNTGTGKELLVQSMHLRSKRSNNAFIAQNCAALPANLLEGILFGTTKGSFTGSIDRPGLFELADKGTLFLDEINSMNIELQAKLLRALQNGYIRRVGGTDVRKVDVRVIAAMNKEPMEEVNKNKLRVDLYYRLNTISIKMTDLKDREGDVELLTNTFIKKFNDKFYRNINGITENALKILNDYCWPGNVRELENIIEGIISITDNDKITVNDLPKSLLNKVKEKSKRESIDGGINLKNAINKFEKEYILNALEKTQWNITKASKLLSIPRQTLQYKLKKYKI